MFVRRPCRIDKDAVIIRYDAVISTFVARFHRNNLYEFPMHEVDILRAPAPELPRGLPNPER